MEADDWISAAGDYEAEVLSVFDRDRAGKVRSLVKRFGWPHKSAIDLGCGPGKFLPLLAERFGAVHACDYSPEMLERAEHRAAKHDNITFERCDLRWRTPSCGAADFVLCTNVLLSPTLSAREKMWANLANSAKPGGRVALVAPSLESALYARHRLVEWNLRSGIAPKDALRESFGGEDPDGPRMARGGLMDAGGIITKHYLQEEIESTAARFGLALESCEKIEYPWTTEFHRPPRWMRAPFPWDWLALLQRVG